MEFAVDFGGFRACFRESNSYGFQHTMSEPTRERITHLRANGLLLDHHGIPPSGADNVSDEEWQALCDMALRSLSSPSATGATSEFVSVPREPTLAMWDAAWKSIGLPYRAKLSLHEIKTLFDKFHAAMLAAAPAPAEPVADRLADSNYRAAFLSGWQACRRGDDRALEAVQNRVGSLQDYIDAAPTAPRVEAGATGWIAAHESGRIHHFSIADGWTVEVVTK